MKKIRKNNLLKSLLKIQIYKQSNKRIFRKNNRAISNRITQLSYQNKSNKLRKYHKRMKAL